MQAILGRHFVVDADAMRALGASLAASLGGREVIFLEGPLGAGKTTFAQGVAAGLGVTGTVASPTYAIVHEYEGGRLPLRHADLYRIESAAELQALGLDERVGVDGVWIVEWASRFPQGWPADAMRVEIGMGEEGVGRWVTIGAETPQRRAGS